MKYTLIITLLFCHFVYAQNTNTTPFQIYNEKGRKVNSKRFLKQLNKGDVILFGELHNNPIAHWLELKVAQHLLGEDDLILGAEMFETDNQKYINQYIEGNLPERAFDTLVRFWLNYETDYKPLVEFAKNNQIPFIATNIPQRFATLVYRKGLEVLETDVQKSEKQYMAPLPIEYNPDLPGYKFMLDMMGDNDHTNENLPKAQAIKDATMAHFIYKNWKKKNHTFLHFNGDYHSKNYEGIGWYLKKMNDNIQIITISTVEQKDVETLEKRNENRANFTIVVDSDMIKTY